MRQTLDIQAVINHIPSIVRRLVLPIFCGLVGIMITLVIGNIPHSYSSLLLLIFIISFTIAHVLWFHKVIQTLRHDLKTSTDSSRLAPPPPLTSLEGEHNHDILVEATFFQLLRDRLNIVHSPYLQAKSLQDNKTHLLQTSGLIPLLKENQLEILTQPIVNLPQKRLSFLYCVPCVTVENGMIIDLNTITESPSNLASRQAMDRMILFQTLEFIRRHHNSHPSHRFICSFSPSLFKDLHCLEEMTEFLHKSHFPFQGLVFEVPLDIPNSLFKSFGHLKHYGTRFIGKWQHSALPKDLTELPIPSVDYVMLPYLELSRWLKNQPRRQSLEMLHQILELSPQTIISNVKKEQDLYHYLPLPFDFAAGDAFGLPKPFYHIQI